MKLPSDILTRPPEEAARRIALLLLDRADRALPRLDDPEDVEALHDFRVAVRRLRSCLRAWRGPLSGVVRKRHRRRLRDIQRATGGGRDAEVFAAWLEGERTTLRGAQRVGHSWLLEEVRRRQDEASGGLDAVKADFISLRDKLGPRLGVMRRRVDLRDETPTGPVFAEALGAKLHEHIDALVTDLGKVTSPDDEETLHEARIEGKRLRYLLDSVRDRVPAVRPTAKRLKGLQDVLGEIHDCHVFIRQLGTAVEQSAAERARRLHALTTNTDVDPAELRRQQRRSERSGLLALTRHARARLESLYADLESEWLGGALEEFAVEVGLLAERLADEGRQGTEVERKYLLAIAPELPEGAETWVIEQGWLPGEALRERLRRITDADGVRHYRTVKLGKGVRRVEVEERCSAELFETLWPLTEGCRVSKRRHRVAVDELIWEVDVFTDRELCLAEVELEDESVAVAFPDWLAPHVDREVTDEGGFTNLALAK